MVGTVAVLQACFNSTGHHAHHHRMGARGLAVRMGAVVARKRSKRIRPPTVLSGRWIHILCPAQVVYVPACVSVQCRGRVRWRRAAP